MDIEGVPPLDCTNKTFSKIASKWSKVLFMENPKDNNYYSKRLCISTSEESLIMDLSRLLFMVVFSKFGQRDNRLHSRLHCG